MAEKRMFAKKIIDSDAFLDMPLSTQALYFHLAMRADDDGFISNPKKIQRMIGASDDDCKLLILKRYILVFETGVIVIKHWRIHNYIRKDTYNATLYQEEKSTLFMKPDGAYTDHPPELPSRTRDEPVDGSLTHVRLDNDRLGEESIGESIGPASRPAPAHKRGDHGYVKLTDAEYEKLIADLGEAEALRVIAYVDESAAATGNKNKWKNWNLVLRKASRDGWGKRFGAKEAEKQNAEREYSGAGFRESV